MRAEPYPVNPVHPVQNIFFDCGAGRAGPFAPFRGYSFLLICRLCNGLLSMTGRSGGWAWRPPRNGSRPPLSIATTPPPAGKPPRQVRTEPTAVPMRSPGACIRAVPCQQRPGRAGRQLLLSRQKQRRYRCQRDDRNRRSKRMRLATFPGPLGAFCRVSDPGQTRRGKDGHLHRALLVVGRAVRSAELHPDFRSRKRGKPIENWHSEPESEMSAAEL